MFYNRELYFQGLTPEALIALGLFNIVVKVMHGSAPRPTDIQTQETSGIKYIIALFAYIPGTCILYHTVLQAQLAINAIYI